MQSAICVSLYFSLQCRHSEAQAYQGIFQNMMWEAQKVSISLVSINVKCYPTNRLLSRGYWILSFFIICPMDCDCEPCKQAQITNWGTGYPHNHFLCVTFEVGCLVVGLRTKQTTTASVKCLSHSQLFNRWFVHPGKLGENQVNKTALLAISKLACVFADVFFFRLQNTTISGLPVLSHGTVCTEHSKVHNELGLSCIMI